MKKIVVIKLCVLAICINAKAQSTIETVLVNIANNNKTILTYTQFWEVQKLKYNTGLTPSNPKIEYDYLLGSPLSAGNLTEFTFAQSLDFPTTYIKKNQLAKQQTALGVFQVASQRQIILLEAKKLMLNLVYRNKLQSQLFYRKENTEKLLSDFKTKLDKGEGNILDVNKTQLQLVEINAKFQENLSSINQLNQKLHELNGGKPILFKDSIYTSPPTIPAFELLEQEYEANDPLRKSLEQEKIVAQTQVEISKTLSLPKMEIGYHYQGILGQTFQGVYAGITIPLWENKNQVKMQKANLLYSDLEIQNHINEKYFEIKQLYEKYSNLKITLLKYEAIIPTINSSILLNKSLSFGQISTIEYFMELSYYYNTYNNYLETEKDFYLVIAELFKYQL